MSNLKEVKCEECGKVIGKATAGMRVQVICQSCGHENNLVTPK